MRKSHCIYSGILATLVGSLSTEEASAHDFAAHDAITRAATSAMHYWVEDGSAETFCPRAGELPTSADFATYKAQVASALVNLRKLRTGLNPVTFDTSGCNQTTNSDGSVTGYYPEDNLDQMGQFRIQDFRYVVERDYATGCKMKALHDDATGTDLTDERWRTLGSVLGTVAGDVDNRTRDTVLWVKPLNAGVWGAMKDGLSLGVTIVGAVFLAPIACLWSLFGGGDCGDAKKWAIKYNPVDFVAGLVPGIPWNFTGEDIGMDINGVWHFTQTNSKGNALTFANNPSGMWYPIAGPGLSPGALDVAIMAVTSAAGVSLNAKESLGVRDFGQFDEADRYWTSWEAHAFSNTEFTPLSKLAKYGKKEYDSSGHTVAAKLGYPLHAFADATFPHHLASTTAWGHRPMEDAINNVRENSLQFSAEQGDIFDDCHRPVDLVLEGYAWWMRYHLGQSGAHVDVEDAVETLAYDARGWVDRHENVWSDSASDQYLLGGKDASTKSYENDHYDPFGTTLVEFAAPMEVAAVGASIAFLVDTGKDVANVQVDPNTRCPPGLSFYHGAGCQTTRAAVTQPTGNGVATTGNGAQSCTSSSSCPTGRVCAKTGANAGTCVPFGSVGTTCLSDSYCGSGLVCAKAGANAGTCAPSGSLGTSCETNSTCATGLECATAGPNVGTCATPGTVGTSCDSSANCAAGLLCATNGPSTGTCVTPQATVGNTCYGGTDCQGPSIICGPQNKCCVSTGATCQATSECCYSDSVCDLQTNKCTAALPPLT